MTHRPHRRFSFVTFSGSLVCLFLFVAGPATADDPRLPVKPKTPATEGTPGEPKSEQPEASPKPDDATASADSDQPALDESGKEVRIFDEVNVKGRADDLLGIADSATEGATGQEDLARRPILRPGELLETVPGVIITQHSGSGKANQYFLRGFNLDHGTDFRVSVEGMQLNFPSHGHGQGYIDLNFLIPELVKTVAYRKGPYNAEDGDFSAAGAADIDLIDEMDEGLLLATPGSFGYRRLLVADSRPVGNGHLLGAFEYQASDGPWKLPEDSRKANGVLRLSQGDGTRGYSITALSYGSRWKSTDQVPLRAIRSGEISRFGFIDPTDGGDSDRNSLSFTFRRGTDTTLEHFHVYALSYSLRLFSNFTFFLDDPINGDQFEQKDERSAAGVELHKRWSLKLGGHDAELQAGFQGRGDRIDNGLFSTRRRERLSATRSDTIKEVTLAPFAQGRIHWLPWLRTIAGLRADWTSVSVDSDLAANSDDRQASQLSPKLSVIFGPWKSAEISLNYGVGFHSNDARGATIRIDPKTGDPATRVPLLVRAKGTDVGLRFQPFTNWNSTFSLFRLDFDSELVFVGDAGGTESGRPSRRQGIEFANFWNPRPWLAIDADITFAHGRFTDDDPTGDRIPGAIDRTIAAGIAIQNVGPLSGSIRVRHFGPRDLIEDGSIRSDSSTLVNAELGWQLNPHVHLTGQVFNLLDQDASDIDYFYTSRLPGEPAEGVDDVHTHPAEPRGFRLTLAWHF